MIHQSRIARLIGVIAFMLCSIIAGAQNSVGVTLNIIPPYSPQFGAYAEQPGKVTLLMKNNTATIQTFYLQVNVAGDNGVSLNTIPGTKSTQPITLQPNQVMQANLTVLRDLFSSTKYNYKGITPTEVFYKNGLPEGNYDICIRAYDYNTNVPLSGDAPTGCRNIQVANLEPPMPIKPMANEELNALLPQNFIFTWTIPAGAQPGTQYKLRVIEMLDPSKNINNAYQSATTPTFFEATIMSNVFVYGPAQPALVKGRKYAWAVTAIAGPKGTAYKNNGISEVRSFTFGKPDVLPPVISLVYPADGAKMLSIQGIDANKFYFKWDYTSPSKQAYPYEDIVMVEVKPSQDAQTAIQQNKRVNTTNEPSKKAMFNYTGGNPDGKTFAWYVTLNDGTKTYKSNYRTFTVNGEAESPVITLDYPADGAKMPSIAGIDANKFYFKWNYTNPGNKVFIEDLVMVEVKQTQNAHDALMHNPRVNSTNEPNKTTRFNYTGGDPDGKTFAWYVTLNSNGKKYKSDARTFTVAKNDLAKNAVIKNFMLCGYPVTVTSITDKGGYKYKGAGFINLYNGGKQVPINFDGLEIQPFNAKSKLNKSKDTVWELLDWRAVSGEVTDKIFNSKFYFNNADNVAGSVWFDIDNLKFTPAIKSHYDAKRKYFIYDGENSSNGVQITGTFNWQTEFFYLGLLPGGQYALYTTKTTTKFDYNEMFGKAEFYPAFKFTSEAGVIPLSKPYGAIIKLVPKLTTELRKTELLAHFVFSGYCSVPGANVSKNVKEKLQVNFNEQKSFVFTVPVDKYTKTLTSDQAISTTFDAVKVNLSGNSISMVTIPSLNVQITTGGQSFSLNYKNAYFKIGEGIGCNGASEMSSAFTLNTFPVTLSKSNISIHGSKLSHLDIDGDINVPFVNQKADLQFSANEKGLQEGYVSFKSGTKKMIYQDVTKGDVCDFTPYAGTLKSDRIVMNGQFTFFNTNGPDFGYKISQAQCPDFYVKGNGDVGMVGSKSFVNQPKGSYNGFKFTPFSIELGRSDGNYTVALSGMLVLADNLASNTQGAPNFTTTAAFPAPIPGSSGGGASKTVSLGSSEVSGICPDKSICDVDGSFTYFNDNSGKGFKFVSDIKMTQPSEFSVHAKMIVAKAPAGFNYWFIEAGAENVAEVPTGVLNLVLYGFTGRVYYKMSHAGKNIDKDDYVADDNAFLGLYALTKLKTQPDNGAMFWGNVSFEILTTNDGIGGVSFRGSGDLVTTGVNTAGLVKAKECTLNFDWQNKSINGHFDIEADFLGAISASGHADFDITPNDYYFFLMASKAKLFGNDKCGMQAFLMELTNKHVRLNGNFNLLSMGKTFDFEVCEPGVTVDVTTWFDAEVAYKPFQFKGAGTIAGLVHVNGCLVEADLGIHLTTQLMFPKPTCVCAGIGIDTPLGEFGITAGIRDGAIIFNENCF